MYRNDIRLGEVQYFTRLPYHEDNHWDFYNVAVIKLYSAPREDLLALSSQTIAACLLTSEVVVVDVIAITSVVAMIPRVMTLPDGEETKLFCQLSQPGLDASVLGIEYDIFNHDVDNDEGEDH